MDRALDWRSPSPGEPGGLVQLHGIDLKGGMELSMGRPLFTRYAQSAEYAVALLADDARSLQERAERLSGRTRQHTPDATEPLVVIVIDELAALIAYQPDRELTRRAEAALAQILSQGRSVGFLIFAFLQDPRKETIRMRHLFVQAIGLRLRDREEVAVVLGEVRSHMGPSATRSRQHTRRRVRAGRGQPAGAGPGGKVSDDMIRTGWTLPGTGPVADHASGRPGIADSTSSRSRTTARAGAREELA